MTMNNELNKTGNFHSLQKVNLNTYSALFPFMHIVRWAKLEVEDIVSRIHLVFFKNLYPSINH